MVNLDKCISYEEYISTAKEEEILFIDDRQDTIENLRKYGINSMLANDIETN